MSNLVDFKSRKTIKAKPMVFYDKDTLSEVTQNYSASYFKEVYQQYDESVIERFLVIANEVLK